MILNRYFLGVKMEDRILNTRNQSLNEKYKILLYGQAGVGKSTVIPTIKNPLVALVEEGNALISLSNFDIPFVKIGNFQNLIDFLDYFKNDTRFDTLVIDSISEVSIAHVQDLLQGKSNGGKKIHGQIAYGQMGDDFNILFDKINACRQDIVCFAKQMRFVSDEGKESFFPLFAGKALAPIMQHKFDAIISMEKDVNNNRFFRTQSNYQYFAKTRSSFPLFEQETPDLGKLLNKIRGIQ